MKHLRLISILAAIAACATANAQDATTVSGHKTTAEQETMQASINFGLHPQIMNVRGRKATCLDGEWKAIVDQFANGYWNYRMKPRRDRESFFADQAFKDDKTRLVEYDFDTDGTLHVPGDWNTQRPELYYFEGTIWYRRQFEVHPQPGKRYFLYFGAVNYEAMVGVNGKAVAKHTGGFTPFNFEVTDLLKDGENTVIVKVDNKRLPEAVPTVNFDWWNYGGITRSVYLIETGQAFVREYSVGLKDKTTIAGWVRMDGAAEGSTVSVAIPELKLSRTVKVDGNGYGEFTATAYPQYWDPDIPKLYDITISCGEEVTRDRVGFRTIEAKGNQLLLNGKPLFCRGVSIHEEMAFGKSGRAWCAAQDKVLLDLAKEMDCNFVRLAHYPHNEDMVRLAEEMGIMVWSEIPVYWTIAWENAQTYENAEAQLTDMITRDRNRANVIIWSVANETPRSPERLGFLTRLIAKAKELDGTRLVSAAMEKEYIDEAKVHAAVSDELAEYADIMSFNQYVGWYDGGPEKCGQLQFSFNVDKPVFISEFGGGALYGNHGDRTERFTEEYQEYLYRQNILMLEKIPGLCGTTPWILKDFRSPRRQLKGIQDDFNRKGLVSEQGQKKMAFGVMQEWYQRLHEEYSRKR